MSLIDQLAIFLHMIAAVFWVGGMFFAYRVLRPSAMQIESPARLILWKNVFERFFPLVWLFIVLIIVTGYWDIAARFDSTPMYIKIMSLLGWLMTVIFAWLYFKPYQVFKKAVEEEDFPLAGQTLQNKIRPIIAVNLALGSLEIFIGAIGVFW